jgi:hypothetical protein
LADSTKLPCLSQDFQWRCPQLCWAGHHGRQYSAPQNQGQRAGIREGSSLILIASINPVNWSFLTIRIRTPRIRCSGLILGTAGGRVGLGASGFERWRWRDRSLSPDELAPFQLRPSAASPSLTWLVSKTDQTVWKRSGARRFLRSVSNESSVWETLSQRSQ